MKKPTFRVELANGTEHVVQVLHGDQLRAELEAGKQGLPLSFEQAPVHHTTLWVWSAMLREGHTSAEFQEFRSSELVMLQRLGLQESGVDPTQLDQPGEQP